MNRFSALICGFALAALVPAGALADTYTFTYTGNDFTRADAPYFDTSESVNGSFTLTSPLASNLTLSTISPSQFDFSDGDATITDSAFSFEYFMVATDAAGNIVNWSVAIQSPDYKHRITTFNETGSITDVGYFFPGTGGAYLGLLNNDPGVWVETVNTSTGTTPEPSSLLLLGSGMLGLAAIRRRGAAYGY